MKKVRGVIATITRCLKKVASLKHHFSLECSKTEERIPAYEGKDAEWKSPIHTFFSIGPSYFTWRYPVDTSCVEKEILDENGLIGPSYYKAIPNAIQNLEDYNNEWFCHYMQVEVCNHLVSDLFVLAEKHHCVGSYTLLASLSDNLSKKRNFMKMAAEGGSPAGMVAYGQILCLNHHVEEGFQWIKKGAEAGQEMGIFMVGLSYQFGTFTPIDYQEAVRWYKLAFEKKRSFFAAVNLGVLFSDAGCFHTAKMYFHKADEYKTDKQKELSSSGYLNVVKNLNTVMTILEYPYKERRKRVVIQQRAPELEPTFCNTPITGKHISPAPIYCKGTDGNPKPWVPSVEDLVEEDILERQKYSSLTLYQQPVVKYPFDNFVFPFYEVKIRHPEILGLQTELVFLEKYAHAELNQYIQNHFLQLRAIFKKFGYFFVYLPAHAIDSQEIDDYIGSFLKEYECEDISSLFKNKNRTENMYWSTLFTKENLPDDCAGFLQFIPQAGKKDRTRYNYILFPHRPGTDWQRAFSEFIKYMSGQPFVEMPGIKPKLESELMLLIDESYHIYITDTQGQQLAEVKMTSLSKVLYFILLKYTDGIAIKELIDCNYSAITHAAAVHT